MNTPASPLKPHEWLCATVSGPGPSAAHIFAYADRLTATGEVLICFIVEGSHFSVEPGTRPPVQGRLIRVRTDGRATAPFEGLVFRSYTLGEKLSK